MPWWRLTLDIFNRHADKLAMANIAQLVNVLQALILTDEDRMLLTPTYHVFDLYQPHRGAISLRTAIEAPNIIYRTGRITRPACRRHRLGLAIRPRAMTLSLVNLHAGRGSRGDGSDRDGSLPATSPSPSLPPAISGPQHLRLLYRRPAGASPVSRSPIIRQLTSPALSWSCLPPASVTVYRIGRRS